MPLDRFHVSDITRHLLPVFPLFASGVGIGWIVTPTKTLEISPVFDFFSYPSSRLILGSLFVVAAYLFIHAVIIESRALYINALRFFITMCLVYGAANVYAFFAIGGSPSEWMWTAFVAYIAAITKKSLQNQDSDHLFDTAYDGTP